MDKLLSIIGEIGLPSAYDHFAEGEAVFGASSGNVLTVLRYDSGKTDGSAFLTVINRGEEECFCVDLSCIGLGIYRAVIGAESAETIRLK